MSETPVTIPLTNSRYIAFFDECADRSLAKINPQFPPFFLAPRRSGAGGVSRHHTFGDEPLQAALLARRRNSGS